MTPEEKQVRIDAIAELREGKGWSYRRIGERLGLSPGYVSWLCLVNAIEKPGTSFPTSRVKPGSIEGRGGHEIRRYTAEEDDELLRLEAAGTNYSAIARALGRKPNSIRGRLATLARREARTGT